MQIPIKNRNYSNGRQTTSLLIYTVVLKFITKDTGEVFKCHLYEGKELMQFFSG